MGQIHHIKKKKNGKHLNFEDRQFIEYLVKKAYPKKVSIQMLVDAVGSSESTIRRELKRGKVLQVSSELVEYHSYSAEIAQSNYDYNATAKGPSLKIAKDYDFVKHVEKKIINDKYSPDAVIMELEQTGFINPDTDLEFATKICTKTLYNYIDQGLFPNLTNKDLPREGKEIKRKQRRIRKSYRSVDGKSIWDRPEEANKRLETGHWEMDCIEGPKDGNGNCLLTMVDRASRITLIFKLANQNQEEVIKVLDSMERKLGRVSFNEKFKTITVDNGSEFLDHKGMEKSLRSKTKPRTQIYYCHPYSSWERGTNEQTNGIIRRFIPKGKVISLFAKGDIQEIEDWLNNYPRRIFDGKSANEIRKNLIKAA
ncbi:MAG: IS30 family transposase [Candidatus Phytoplasma sp.]|nr:IS30 family transposase [Phytoplasma sp.]